MNVAFFHGLESPAVSEKNGVLDSVFTTVYAPPMDYRDSALFKNILQEVKNRKIDLLIGSSMGGWFAYCISSVTGIPTLLFNPAVQGRSFDPVVNIGSQSSQHTIILGKKDDVVIPEKTQEWLNENSVKSYSISWENMGHRIPINIFKKWCLKVNKGPGKVLEFKDFMLTQS